MLLTTAVEMARDACIDPKAFRAALRKARLEWHSPHGRWEVRVGSSQHRDMQLVLERIGGDQRSLTPPALVPRTPKPNLPAPDEAYVIDLCDDVLGHKALRQYCFDFLVGDPNEHGRCARLPVDAFYPALKLVVEYHERQHSERVEFFDRKSTVSGVGRGEQRRLYDQRRRVLLPEHGFNLVCLDYSQFPHGHGKRLCRVHEDRSIIQDALRAFVR